MYNWNTQYRIIDNFLSDKDFKLCQDYFKYLEDNRADSSVGWYREQNNIIVNKHGRIIDYVTPTPFIFELFIKYNHKLEDALEELAPERKKDYARSTVEFVSSRTGLKWEIHPDVSEKLLSAVLYVSPKVNTGTILYKDKNGLDPYEVEWKENRCLIFCQTNDSWHSYQNTHEETRNTISWNLRSSKDNY